MSSPMPVPASPAPKNSTRWWPSSPDASLPDADAASGEARPAGSCCATAGATPPASDPVDAPGVMSAPLPALAAPLAPLEASVAASASTARTAASRAASVMAAVPWMSSLKEHSTGLYRSSSLKALVFPKSSHCSSTCGRHAVSAAASSPTNASYSAPRARRRRSPLYPGSASSFSLLVPTSRHSGRHTEGSTPAAAVYSVILPSLMPMPPAPRSPRPRMRSPSVTTITRTFCCGQALSLSRMWPLSSRVRYRPRVMRPGSS
mmetsp:Transcript_10518/g.26102  ORF Transcript_10518/g.26102 Transcript_10518/m.26102 type:complete len:262 (-) Transcript_10518:257-1042(-)